MLKYLNNLIFDHLLIVEVVFEANICWLHLLTCDDLLFSPFVHHCKLNIFGFWTIGWMKTSNLKLHLRLLEIEMGSFRYFLTSCCTK